MFACNFVWAMKLFKFMIYLFHIEMISNSIHTTASNTPKTFHVLYALHTLFTNIYHLARWHWLSQCHGGNAVDDIQKNDEPFNLLLSTDIMKTTINYWRQAIIWTNAGILSIGPLGTNVSETLIEIHTFSFKKMHLKMSSGKWRPFCLGLNELIHYLGAAAIDLLFVAAT